MGPLGIFCSFSSSHWLYITPSPTQQHAPALTPLSLLPSCALMCSPQFHSALLVANWPSLQFLPNHTMLTQRTVLQTLSLTHCPLLFSHDRSPLFDHYSSVQTLSSLKNRSQLRKHCFVTMWKSEFDRMAVINKRLKWPLCLRWNASEKCSWGHGALSPFTLVLSLNRLLSHS